MNVNLEFDPNEHRYFIDGSAVPSVTQVLEPLQELDGIPRAALDLARERGQHVHSACHLMIHRALEWRTLDPQIVGYVEAAQKFLREADVRVLASEYHMGDPHLRFGGTLDFLGLMNRITAVFDWKAVDTMPRTAGPQTAAYDYLYRRTLGGTRPFKRYGVQLFANGTYKLHAFESPLDWTVFASALNIHNFRHNGAMK